MRIFMYQRIHQEAREVFLTFFSDDVNDYNTHQS